MANNIIKYNSRITLKYDTLSNWRPNGTWINFTPLKGEVCIIDPTEDLGPGAACLIKIGNGIDDIGTLNYLSATAADVYDWAKLSPENIVTLLNEGTFGTITLGKSFATDEELADAVSTLEGAIGDVEDAVDALGKSLAKEDSGGIRKTITKIEYDEDTNEATVTYEDIPSASTDATGLVKLNNAINSISTTEAATANAVKTAYDKGANALEVAKAASSAAGQANTAIGNIIGGTTTVGKALKDGDNNEIAKTYATKTALKELNDALADVSNVMNFRGVATADPTTITKGYNNGDVVIYGSKEYVYNGDKEGGSFVEFGDTSSQNQAIEGLESALEEVKSYATIKGDNNSSATAEVVNDTLTINGDAIITVEVTDAENDDKVTISHKKVTKADESNLTDTVKLTPSINTDTFTAVDSIVYDAYGHVSAVKTKTVTVDVTDINSKIGGLENGINSHKSFSTVKAGSTSLVADSINDTLNVSAGTAISVTGNASTDTMTIAHANVTRTDASPIDKPTVKVALDHQTAENGKQDKFVAVTGVTTNAQGHVTAVEHTEFTMPDVEEIDSRIGILERDTWKTVTRNKVTQVDDNTDGNFTTGLQDSEGNSTLNKSDLTIGTDVIGYIIWDCGSASKNI